jgi:CRP-like cAMP-binding protein
MRNPWVMKMEQFTRFTPEQRARLDALMLERQEDYAAGQDILTEGQKMDECHVVVSGLAARYKLLPNGGRQIMAFLVPGDLCDAEVFVLEEMDHSVYALVPTRCAIIKAATMKDMLREISCLAEALWWGTMTDLAVLRERIVDHGRRDAHERIAHLIYELLIRYRLIEAMEDAEFPFPITQEELADATGMTPVHVSRTLRQLRAEGLVEIKSRRLKVTDPEGLKKAAQFNANYLHLKRTEGVRTDVSARAGDLV